MHTRMDSSELNTIQEVAQGPHQVTDEQPETLGQEVTLQTACIASMMHLTL